MKKLLLYSFITCLAFSPVMLSAQKKSTPKKPIKTIEPIILATDADSISYALGVTMIQSGLKGYLSQMGVLADTAAVEADYNAKISNEENAVAKTKLNKEMQFKIDSIKSANENNLAEFMDGFNEAMGQSKDKNAYNTGMAIGTQLATAIVPMSKEMLGGEDLFNKKAFIAAFSAALKDETLLIENTESIMSEASMKAQAKKEAEAADNMKAEYASQIEAGDKFMEENKTKDGVVTLPSGLQYKVIEMGTGEQPAATDRVTVHYKGTLLDGTVFDSSYDRGEPITLGVNQVIKGWTEALLLMPSGSKWELYIPYDLAYGSRDQGTIKPFSNLVFEVELISIEK